MKTLIRLLFPLVLASSGLAQSQQFKADQFVGDGSLLTGIATVSTNGFISITEANTSSTNAAKASTNGFGNIVSQSTAITNGFIGQSQANTAATNAVAQGTNNYSASMLSSGTVADARLSANVALLNNAAMLTNNESASTTFSNNVIVDAAHGVQSAAFWLGGQTASFARVGSSGTELRSLLGDASNFAPFHSAAITAGGSILGSSQIGVSGGSRFDSPSDGNFRLLKSDNSTVSALTAGSGSFTGTVTNSIGFLSQGTNTLIFTTVSALTNTLGYDATASVSAGTSVAIQDRNGNAVDTIGTIATLHVLVPLRANWRLTGTGISATLY